MLNRIQKIRETNKKETFVLSGAMGTEILRRGVSTTLPLWSTDALITNPEVIEQIHIDYIKAGAQIITTNTFRTQWRTLTKAAKGDKAKAMTILACNLAKNAVKKTKSSALIAGSIAPLEDCYSPKLTPSDKELIKEHLEHAQNLKDGGVDILFLETMITLRETSAALLAAKKVSLPFAVSFCCDQKGNLLSGESLEDAVKLVSKYKPVFISINCINVNLADKLVKKIKSLTDIPIGCYAQGDGVPDDKDGWKFTNHDGSKTYLQHAKKWIKDGVQFIGGCCGTNPDYISKLTTNVMSMMQTSPKEVSL